MRTRDVCGVCQQTFPFSYFRYFVHKKWIFFTRILSFFMPTNGRWNNENLMEDPMCTGWTKMLLSTDVNAGAMEGLQKKLKTFLASDGGYFWMFKCWTRGERVIYFLENSSKSISAKLGVWVIIICLLIFWYLRFIYVECNKNPTVVWFETSN